jgi:tetratricopeptide (TPR) repeat protein
MQQYGVRDVEKMLRLSRSTIRALASAGFVTPARGPRNTLRFSFQDLIVLRAAQTLADAHVPARRITRSLKALRRQLPDTMPLSGLSISAEGEQVVVRDRAGRRQAESGQYLLAFEGDPADGTLSVVETPPPRAQAGQDWFVHAVALERADLDAAVAAYQKAIAAEPDRLDARINLGRLLHESGRHRDAERVYRRAVESCGPDPLLLYNFGVLLGDMNRGREAVQAYEAALRGDPALADAHYNVSLQYQKLGRPREAIRHMSQYRRLQRG